jgi:hypothetical protein
MNLNFIKYQPKTRLLVIFLGLFLGFSFILLLIINLVKPPELEQPVLNSKKQQPAEGIPIILETGPLQEDPTFKSYQQTVIGKTTSKDIQNFAGLVKIEDLGSNRQLFFFTSADALRDNLIETKNGIAIYKRVVSITSDDYDIARFSPYLAEYGKPEAEFTGSGRYGPLYKTYVYPERGFAFIVNPATDAVYEIQSFVSTTLEQYLLNWGQDIKEAKEQELRRATEGYNEGALE